MNALARRQAVHRQFSDAGIKFSFFDAFDGSTIRLEDHFDGLDQDTYRLNTYRAPHPGEIGCFASHLALWKVAANSSEPIVILEDDCRLSRHFRASLDVAERLVDSLGFIRLERLQRREKPRINDAQRHVLEEGRFAVHYLLDVPLCLLAYAISPNAASQLIQASDMLTSPVDKLVQRTWEHGVGIFGLSPSPVETSRHAEHSTIGDRSNKQRDPVTVIRRTIYKSKGEFRRAAFNRTQIRRLKSAPAIEP